MRFELTKQLSNGVTARPSSPTLAHQLTVHYLPMNQGISAPQGEPRRDADRNRTGVVRRVKTWSPLTNRATAPYLQLKQSTDFPEGLTCTNHYTMGAYDGLLCTLEGCQPSRRELSTAMKFVTSSRRELNPLYQLDKLTCAPVHYARLKVSSGIAPH